MLSIFWKEENLEEEDDEEDMEMDIDEDGNMIDGSLGLWVQYQHTIDDEPVLIPREDGGYTVK